MSNNDIGIAESYDSPYYGDMGEGAWICEDPDLANLYVINHEVRQHRDIKAGELLLIYGVFKKQIPFLYTTFPNGTLQPTKHCITPTKYNDSHKIQSRLLIAERALAATYGDPIKASQNMFIPTDTPCCSLCKVRSDDSKVNLKLCARCHQKSYCCKECQVVDWKLYHKFECISHLVTTHTKGILTPKSI